MTKSAQQIKEGDKLYFPGTQYGQYVNAQVTSIVSSKSGKRIKVSYTCQYKNAAGVIDDKIYTQDSGFVAPHTPLYNVVE